MAVGLIKWWTGLAQRMASSQASSVTAFCFVGKITKAEDSSNTL